MKNINIEEVKREIKAKTGVSIVAFTLLLTLMGCGKTNQDTVVTPEPDTTVETVVEPEDDEITIPTDVSDNEVVTPVEEEKELPEPTFVLTGDNQYTVYVNCSDNSNAAELQDVYDLEIASCISRNSDMYGVSENLLVATMAYGMQNGSHDVLFANIENHKDVLMTVPNRLGVDTEFVITNDPDSYPETYTTISANAAELDNILIFKAYAILLRDSLEYTNGNVSCAVARTYTTPDIWEQIMGECMDATGLTAEEIYKNYGFDFVIQYDTLGLCDHECASKIMSYVGNEPITVKDYSTSSEITYTIETEKILRFK